MAKTTTRELLIRELQLVIDELAEQERVARKRRWRRKQLGQKGWHL